VSDRLGRSAAHDPVAPTDLDRLAGKPDNPIHQLGVHLAPHKTMHAAERTADDEPQMRDIEPLGDEPLHAVDHIVAAIVREISFEPV